MSLTASVVSAAILEGNLIIGLSDGSVINCGYVQGPPGLKGDPGPMGADGDAGRDGNTIITVAGTPRNDAGTDGDYAIDNVNWRIYGPKSGGTWGKANEMLPSKENLIVNGRGFEGGAGGSGDSGGGGGGEGIRLIMGGDGIKTDVISDSITEVDADIDTDQGLTFASGKIALSIGEGLEFDATTGKLKTSIDPDEYAKVTYVDEKTKSLPYRIETDKVTREGKAQPFSGEAEIQLVDSEDNYSNVKFTGTNGVDVSSTASSIVIDGAQLTGDINLELDNYATKTYSDNGDKALQNQIDDLEVQKGAAANYDCVAVSGAFIPRPGEFGLDNATASSAVMLGIGSADKSGKLTKTINIGDIIEIQAADGSDTRYKATDVVGAPEVVAVTFVSGEQTFVVGQQYTLFIYPQNEAAASKDYVDAQDELKVNRAGDRMTGALNLDTGSSFDTALEIKKYTGPGTRETTVTISADGKYTGAGIIKSIRNTGYAFEVKPDDATTISYLHTDGTFAFGGKGTITGNLDITTATTEGVRVLGNFKVKAANQTIGGSNVFEMFEDKGNYTGAISSDNNLVNKKYVDDHSGGGVVVHNGSTPPASEPRGTMLLTTANALYIYL